MVRGLIAGLAALLLAVQVVRVATVEAFARSQPETAARFWPGHPAVALSSGLTEIAAATRERRPIRPEVLQRLFAVSGKAPLAEEPFLVRGVQAQLAGDRTLAGEAFLAAKWRDGRSLPARYFLAEHYFIQRDAGRGLGEIAALSRLVPDGVKNLAPYVAEYARNPANRARVHSLLQAEPRLAEATLAQLASDPRNADLILALSRTSRDEAENAWLPVLLDGLVKAGEPGKARRVWAQASGARIDPRSLLFDPGFEDPTPPPPFNWALTSSTVGLAERVPGGGLHLIYYGQEDGTLASQLLVLPAGSYRLAMRFFAGASNSDALRWRLVCATSSAEIQSAPLAAADGSGWSFEVPTGCAGQRLELYGTSGDLPRQSDIRIGSLRLTRERANG